MLRLRVAAVGLGLAVLVTGCERRFFHATGAVVSDGGMLGRWSTVPVSCSRGLRRTEDGGAGTVTLLWENPVFRNKRYRNQGQLTAPVVPLRLDVMGDGEGATAVLDVWRRSGVVLDRQACRRLSLETHEGASAVAEGRATLGGRLRMDCQAGDSHVTADLAFRGCEF